MNMFIYEYEEFIKTKTETKTKTKKEILKSVEITESVNTFGNYVKTNTETYHTSSK